MPKPADFLEDENKRYFEIDEANAHIPWLTHTFATVAKLRLRLEQTDAPELIDRLQHEIEDLLNVLVRKGIEVVDVEQGVVNFYAWDDDEEVILSWQFGETEIHFWHEPFEDFCHRRPLRQITAEAPKEGPAIH